MNKVIKLVSVLLMVVMLTASFSTVCLAGGEGKTIIKPSDIEVDENTQGAEMGNLADTAKKIVATIRNIAAILAVVLIAILGIKFMMGSTEEKAEYKKSFIPLIIGVVVVLMATSIASFIWNIVG